MSAAEQSLKAKMAMLKARKEAAAAGVGAASSAATTPMTNGSTTTMSQPRAMGATSTGQATAAAPSQRPVTTAKPTITNGVAPSNTASRPLPSTSAAVVGKPIKMVTNLPRPGAGNAKPAQPAASSSTHSSSSVAAPSTTVVAPAAAAPRRRVPCCCTPTSHQFAFMV